MIEPRFVEKEAFQVVGAAARGQMGSFDYSAVWEKQYMPFDELLKPYSIDGGYYGMTLEEGDHLLYLAGMAVAGLPEIPAGAEMRQIPAARYAVFECGLSAIGATWREAYEQWLPSSVYQAGTSGDFEYYLPYSGEGEMKVEIYIPVKVAEPQP